MVIKLVDEKEHLVGGEETKIGVASVNHVRGVIVAIGLRPILELTLDARDECILREKRLVGCRECTMIAEAMIERIEIHSKNQLHKKEKRPLGRNSKGEGGSHLPLSESFLDPINLLLNGSILILHIIGGEGVSADKHGGGGVKGLVVHVNHKCKQKESAR